MDDTHTHPSRFIDTGKWLANFTNEVWVKCYQCELPGRVFSVRDSDEYWPVNFECSGCEAKLSANRFPYYQDRLCVWVGPVMASGRRPCGYCGHQWLAPRLSFSKMPEILPASIIEKCTECGHSSVVDLTLSTSVPGDHCIEPHFGLPLLLVDSNRLGAIWVYNRAHLNELQGYVSAKLRVRDGGPAHRSMFSRMPKWIKLAKHRDTILKSLKKIESQLNQLELKMSNKNDR